MVSGSQTRNRMVPAAALPIEGVAVAGFHLFALPDDLDPRDGALVVFAVDIWSNEFPD